MCVTSLPWQVAHHHREVIHLNRIVFVQFGKVMLFAIEHEDEVNEDDDDQHV